MSRILFLNWKHLRAADAGGAEQYVERVADIWAEWGHDVTVLTPSARGKTADPMWRFTSVYAGTNRLNVFRAARNYLRHHGDTYDAVIESVSTHPFWAHEIVGDKATALYMQIADDVWNEEYIFPVSAIGRYILEPRWIRRLTGSRVVAISQSTVEDLARFGVNCIGIAPPGLDVPEHVQIATQPEHGTYRLIFVGRLVQTKRPQDAIEAFRQLQRTHPTATLDIVGDGYLKTKLERSAPSGVTFHGYVSAQRKHDLLGQSHCCLVPGTREGWGIVGVEAAAHGVPVVAYDIPGLRDSVQHEITGLRVSATPHALAQGAEAVVMSPTTWSRFSQDSSEWAQGFSWNIAAEQLASTTNAQLPAPPQWQTAKPHSTSTVFACIAGQ